MEERRRQLLEEADGYVCFVPHHLVTYTSAWLNASLALGPTLAADYRTWRTPPSVQIFEKEQRTILLRWRPSWSALFVLSSSLIEQPLRTLPEHCTCFDAGIGRRAWPPKLQPRSSSARCWRRRTLPRLRCLPSARLVKIPWQHRREAAGACQMARAVVLWVPCRHPVVLPLRDTLAAILHRLQLAKHSAMPPAEAPLDTNSIWFTLLRSGDRLWWSHACRSSTARRRRATPATAAS